MFHRSLTANIVEPSGPAEEAGQAGRPPRLIRPIRRCGRPGSSPEKPRASTEAIPRAHWAEIDTPFGSRPTARARISAMMKPRIASPLPASRSRDSPRSCGAPPAHRVSMTFFRPPPSVPLRPSSRFHVRTTNPVDQARQRAGRGSPDPAPELTAGLPVYRPKTNHQ